MRVDPGQATTSKTKGSASTHCFTPTGELFELPAPACKPGASRLTGSRDQTWRAQARGITSLDGQSRNEPGRRAPFDPLAARADDRRDGGRGCGAPVARPG